MYQRQTKIINTTGLHARPASEFALKAKEFESSVTIRRLDTQSEPVNAKSIVRLLSLGIGKGTDIEIIALGPDEQLAVDTLTSLVESGFGE